MKKRKEQPKHQYIEARLIRRLRIYLIVMLVVFAAIVIEVLEGRFGIQWAFIGVLIGLVVGIIVSRSYHLSWDVETHNVIGRIDWIGSVLLVCYLVFLFNKSYFLGFYVQGAPLFAIILGTTAGTMLGRILGTRHGINKLLKTLNLK
ncbi:MAG: hypothetical protein WBZ42_05480 [Halobacteriota archaeon]